MRAADPVRQLPWLAPSTAALAALASAKHPWHDPVVRTDPGAVVLLLRFQKSVDKPILEVTSSERADLLRFAIKRLRSQPIGVVYNLDAQATSLRIAELAERFVNDDVSAQTRVVGLLTALVLSSPPSKGGAGGGIGVLSALKGMGISKNLDTTVRLARRWGLPPWCVSALSALNHPATVAESLGANKCIVAAVRAAAWLIEPALLNGLDIDTLAEANLDAASARELANEIPILAVQPYENSYDAPLLLDLLRAAERNHRRDTGELLRALEGEVGRLHSTLADRQQTETERLRNRKLTAVAEFAAGAGHEINTPLAIISGQAQLMLQNEDDTDRRKALDTIVQQARRIHDILTDLMQFARPAKPVTQTFDLSILLREVADTFRATAADRNIRIDDDYFDGRVAEADPRHVRTAIQGLIRNAVEAAPTGGWVRTRIDEIDGQLHVTIEDSGPGPDPAIVDHLFDPFFSGRPAGRGRGLGLPTAWRLAREQGGDVRYEASNGGPTRFVLTLPRAEALPAPERMSA